MIIIITVSNSIQIYQPFQDVSNFDHDRWPHGFETNVLQFGKYLPIFTDHHTIIHRISEYLGPLRIIILLNKIKYQTIRNRPRNNCFSLKIQKLLFDLKIEFTPSFQQKNKKQKTKKKIIISLHKNIT